MPVRPPKLAQRLLLRFLRNELAEEVTGDLEEKFYRIMKNKSPLRAKLNYWYQVMNYMRPFAVRKSKSMYLNQFAMFQSYLKIGWRSLFKNAGYSFINIGGLALGMAVAMLNGFWIWDELSFNANHKNYDRIAQVITHELWEGEKEVGHTMTYPLGVELRTNYLANFKHVMRASWVRDYIISSGENKISAQGQFIDAEGAEMLSLNMVYGNWHALSETHSLILSSSMAKSLFGDIDPTDKIVTISNKREVKITGVYQDLPVNSTFHAIKFFGPWDLFLLENEWIEKRAVNDWTNHFIKIYAEIQPGDNFEGVSDRIEKVIVNKVSDLKDVAARDERPFLHPMSQWHLFPYTGDRLNVNKEPVQMIWLVGSIGGFVLLLACINFMNLSTARSESRAKEVGVRKAIGSGRTQLIQQFFSESFIVVIFAFALAILAVTISLPWFNDLSAKQITVPWSNSWFWMISIGFIFITGLLAGSYPALFLSSFEPVKVLKGTFRFGRFSSLPRRILVVVQFTVSVTLIISTIIVYQQIQFAKNRATGYSREGLIMVEKKNRDFYGKYEVLRNELKNTGVVVEISESMGKMTEVWSGNNGFDWGGKDHKKDESFGTLSVSPTHGKTVGWQFIKGRDFSTEFASDSNGLVINEAAAKFMELKDPVGEAVTWTWWKNDRPPIHYKILGVIRDVVMDSPYEPIEPTVFYIKGLNGSPNWINIKIDPQVSTSEALPKIEAVFKKIIPSAPFDYKFVDEEYARKFVAEERIGKLASVFGIFATVISCLGLFGLASFVAGQKTKEIGIRKVLGASVTSLWRMLSKDFALLVVVSCFIAVPIAWYFLNTWLQKYSYRVEISWWIFALTGVGAIVITLLTVSYQAIKAALMNPVNSLKSE